MDVDKYKKYFESLSCLDLSECDRINLVFQKMLKDFKIKGLSHVSIEEEDPYVTYVLVSGGKHWFKILGVDINVVVRELYEYLLN